ncbi:MAG: hypothetical protein MGU50_25335 [Trichodesmium sp. MAG_R02]|nr:hypothetical protein [Trichodesmium sp. MAG_R02]
MTKLSYSAFQIDEPHRHNQNLVGTLHKGVPTVVDRHKKCCNSSDFWQVDLGFINLIISSYKSGSLL